jgi:lipase chaperone LimK
MLLSNNLYAGYCHFAKICAKLVGQAFSIKKDFQQIEQVKYQFFCLSIRIFLNKSFSLHQFFNLSFFLSEIGFI